MGGGRIHSRCGSGGVGANTMACEGGGLQEQLWGKRTKEREGPRGKEGPLGGSPPLPRPFPVATAAGSLSLVSENVELILKSVNCQHGPEADQPDYDSVASDEEGDLETSSGKASRQKVSEDDGSLGGGWGGSGGAPWKDL